MVVLFRSFDRPQAQNLTNHNSLPLVSKMCTRGAGMSDLGPGVQRLKVRLRKTCKPRANIAAGSYTVNDFRPMWGIIGRFSRPSVSQQTDVPLCLLFRPPRQRGIPLV